MTAHVVQRRGLGTLWVQTADGSVIDCDQFANLFRTDFACWGGNPTVASLGTGTYSSGSSVTGSGITINPSSPGWSAYLIPAAAAIALVFLLKR